MDRKRYYFIGLVAVGIVLTAAAAVRAAERVTAGLLDAAEKEARSFVASNREKLPAHGLIDPSDKLEDLRLGSPYPQYILKEDDVPRLTADNFKEVIVLNQWAVPVFFGDNPRFLIFLRNYDGEWKRASAGGNPTLMLNAMERWKPSEGYELSHVVESPWGPDFIMIEKGGEIRLYSFRERNERMFNITKDENGWYPLLTVPDVVSRIKEMEQRYLDEPKR